MRNSNTRRALLIATTVIATGVAIPATARAAASRGTASVAGSTLTVSGTAGPDTVTLRLAVGDPGRLEVAFGNGSPAGATFDRAKFSAIHVALSAGDDTFSVDQSNGAFTDEALSIDGASGNDVIGGGDGNEVVDAGSGNDFVDTNRGADAVHLGSGRDLFVWDPGDGSDAVAGDTGTDTMTFFGSNADESMTLSANGGDAVLQRDVGAIRMVLSTIEIVDVAARGGVDTVTIDNLAGTGVRNAHVDLSAGDGSGDQQADVVVVNGTEQADAVNVEAFGPFVGVSGLAPFTSVSGEERTDRLQVNTLGGNDAVDVGAAASALIDVVVDLGSGQV